MGDDAGRGELRQLVVEGGWWKASEVPDEDLREARAEEGDKGLDATGCLISEVVVPGALAFLLPFATFPGHAILTTPARNQASPSTTTSSSLAKGSSSSLAATSTRQRCSSFCRTSRRTSSKAPVPSLP